MGKNKQRIVFVSDFFVDLISRGAELANDALLHYLDNEYKIERVRSENLLAIDTDKFYIISNFVMLPEKTKEKLIEHKNYLIYEHDHKYVITRNPFSVYDTKRGTILDNPPGIVPKDSLINVSFYESAKVVMCQTKWHQDQLEKNLTVTADNIGGSLYKPETINLINSIAASTKKISVCAIFNEINNYKNHQEAMDFCKNNNIPFKLIPRLTTQKQFLHTLGRFNSFAFFPKIPETCSRLLIEARLLNCLVYTNSNSGIVNESYWTMDNESFKDYLINVITPQAINKFRRVING
jgi:hypothetical protein